MKLKPLSLSDMEPIRNWRNEQLPMLRTSFPLTQPQQLSFYSNTICNRNANARYWGIHDGHYLEENLTTIQRKTNLIGMAGIENIQWENRLGEISLLIKPHGMDKYGEDALTLILHEGFMNMNLDNIFTEVYGCSPYLKFWSDQLPKYKTRTIAIPNRKYHNGEYWDGHYINFNKGDFLNNENITS